jgi:hypothetical protein
MLDDGQIAQSIKYVDFSCHRVRHAAEAHPGQLGEVAEERKIRAISGDPDVVFRVRPTKPLMGLVRVVAPEFLVMNGLD